MKKFSHPSKPILMWALLSTLIFFAVACLLGALIEIEPLWQISAIAFSIALSLLVITNPLQIVRRVFRATAWLYRAEWLFPLKPASNRMVILSLFVVQALFAALYLLGVLLDSGMLQFGSMVGFWAGLIVVFIIPLPLILRWFVRSVRWFGKSFWRSLLLARAFYRWLNFRRIIYLSLGFCALVLLFYEEEDVRGWWAWQHFKHEWEAKGERFDYASIVPPPVPDDQNFALTPVVASCYEWGLTKDGKRITPFKTNVVNRLRMTPGDYSNYAQPPHGNLGWASGQSTDLKAWQDSYRTLATKTNEFPVPVTSQSPATDVLLALSKYDSTIDELRKASTLSYSRFPLNYSDMEHDSTNQPVVLLMHLWSIQSCIQVLNLRAIAELENGQGEKALDDVKLALRLVDATRTEPNMSSQFYRTEEMKIVFQAIWEGLAKHKWTDAQLADIEQELGKLDFLADSQMATRGERNESLTLVDYFRKQRPYDEFRRWISPGITMSPSPGDRRRLEREATIGAIICCSLPAGWFYQNEVVIGKAYQQSALQMTDPIKHLAFPKIEQDGYRFVNSLPHTPWNVFARTLAGGSLASNRRLVYAQETTDLASIACALERYRLAHGQYPDVLAELAPQFIEKIPHDIIGGQPLHYRRTDDGKYLLYSVGWNEIDDGGKLGLRESGYHDSSLGDWVWPCH